MADEIQRLHEEGTSYRDVAVFYRTNSQTRALEEIFIRSAIPYRVLGGTKFYERAEIKDAMAYLITVANPADPLSLRRILNVPKRGIGAVTETALQRYADEHETSVRDALRHADELGFGPKVRNAITAFAELLDSVSEKAPTQPVVDTAHAAARRLGPAREPAEVAGRAGRRAGEQHRRARRGDARVPKNNPEGTLSDFLTEVCPGRSGRRARRTRPARSRS